MTQYVIKPAGRKGLNLYRRRGEGPWVTVGLGVDLWSALRGAAYSVKAWDTVKVWPDRMTYVALPPDRRNAASA